ncbi:hypothetical protein ACHAPT_008990 [Fusarium lateritium]
MSDPPPSYDDVVKHLDAQVSAVGQGFGPTDLSNLKSSLTPEQTQALVDNLPANPTDPTAYIDVSKLTDEQQQKLRDGMAYAAAHPEIDQLMQAQIDDTAKSTATIKRIFTELLASVGELDAKYLAPGQVPFARYLLDIKNKFDFHISSTAEMATRISLYASRFGEMLPYVKAADYNTSDRMDMLAEFIVNNLLIKYRPKEADIIEADANAVVTTFTQLNDDMANFVASFASWASEREQADRAEVIDLNKQIGELGDKIAQLKAAQIAMGVIAAASLPAAGTLSVCFPPAAPFILIGGAILAGVSAGAMIGITIALNAKQSELAGLEQKRATLQQDADDIKATREKAQDAGSKDLAEFGAAIGNLSTVWQTCKNDAQSCSYWLEKTEKDKIPPILAADQDKVIGLYNNMAKYLKAYADGVQQVPVSPAK